MGKRTVEKINNNILNINSNQPKYKGKRLKIIIAQNKNKYSN